MSVPASLARAGVHCESNKVVKMPTVDRWLLPDGIEEVLPEEAARIEMLGV